MATPDPFSFREFMAHAAYDAVKHIKDNPLDTFSISSELLASGPPGQNGVGITRTYVEAAERLLASETGEPMNLSWNYRYDTHRCCVVVAVAPPNFVDANQFIQLCDEML